LLAISLAHHWMVGNRSFCFGWIEFVGNDCNSEKEKIVNAPLLSRFPMSGISLVAPGKHDEIR
jgi:hypothetical protein